MVINKAQFIENMSKDINCSKKDAAFIVNEFIKGVEKVMAEGNSVKFSGFGTFEVREMSPKSVRTISGDMKQIPVHYVPKFSAGERLRMIVKENCFGTGR